MFYIDLTHSLEWNIFLFSRYMYRSSFFLTTTLIGTMVALVQPMTQAKSSVEVGRIAKAITVEIKQNNSDRVGSGILLQKQGKAYTVLTAGHVVESGVLFTIKTSDGQVHQAIFGSVRSAGSRIDLAVLKFRSSNNYTLAKIGTSNSLEELSPIYVAGFPYASYAIAAGTINITKGEVVGNASQGNDRGYSLIYSNITRPGMSGGPVLNEAGELVAIHGQGDRDGKTGEGEKTGRNLGIVVERFAKVALAMGVQLDQRVAALPQSLGLNASDYFLRGFVKEENSDYEGAIADYNQVIALNPKYSSNVYYRRGRLKDTLNNIQGALLDYNQAILLDKKNPYAYHSRALLKKNNLNDRAGAIQDFRQAARLYRERGDKFFLAIVNSDLKNLGTTE
jgi:tetratricopeptide (TPR) repeat protein